MTAEKTTPSAAKVGQTLHRTGMLDLPTAWYLGALLIPLALYVIMLKVIRILAQPEIPSALGVIEQLASDVAFGIGFGLGWMLIIAATGHHRTVRRVAIVLMHIGAVAIVAVTTAFHVYFRQTGSPLTLQRLLTTFQSFGEIAGLLGSELNPGVAALLFGSSGYVILGPALVRRLITGRQTASPFRPPARRALISVAALTVGLLLASCYSGPSFPSYFSRTPVLAVGLSPLDNSIAKPPKDLPELESVDPPTDTTLTPGDKAEKRNVVMITLESQRATATTPPLGDPALTPNLTELAKSSLVAEQAYAILPHTSKSLTATYCGIEPPLDTKNSEADELGVAARCLPDLLAELGYRSKFFQSAVEDFERRRELITSQLGFQEFEGVDTLPTDGFAKANYLGWEDDIMLGPSREWIEQDPDSPFLLSYLTITAHHDFKVPEGFPVQDLSEDPEFNGYLNALRYQDRFVGKVIQQIKDLGLYDDTIFVISADHGEGFGEHHLSHHDNTPYQEGVLVPMLVHDPQRFANGATVTEPVQHSAILPTVAELLGYSIEGGSYRSASLLSNAPRPPIKISCYEEARCLARIDGSMKYIYHYGFRHEEVFDLELDPGERTNIASSIPADRRNRYRIEVLQWRRQVEQMYETYRGSGHPGPGQPR